ncbi:MAG: nicotinamide riboside transporter PnuC [Bacteroidota bacterium]
MDDLSTWIAGHWVEVAAAVISIIYVILGVRQVKWLWGFGLISAGLYAWVYGHSGFYAGMCLQGYYAAISVYGWWNWNRRTPGADKSGSLPVTHLPHRTGCILLGVFILLWSGIALILDRMTDSTIPVWDALTTSGGIVATWMLARKILQHWLVWIVVDGISIGLYLWQGLYATTVLFVVYVFMAVIGYFQWKKTMVIR